jgi:tRNA threonylcarbamoyladenosine biosynthesis protein TsaB
MPKILHLETSTQICSVALSDDSNLLGKRVSRDERSHSRQLAVFIQDLLKLNELDASQLDAVAVSIGPGSYTGLRIGVSTAKGIAYGAQIPLIGIGTLDLLVQGALRDQGIKKMVDQDHGSLLCPMIDARRMEVYTALYLASGDRISEVEAKIIDDDSYAEKLHEAPVIFFGNGAGKCQGKINHPNAMFVAGIETNAEYMILLAERSWQNKIFEDVAYVEPFYLKDFIATIPKNKVIQTKVRKHGESG